MAILKTPPKANELEFSLFGPGIGECAVIHLGSGKWMVVDSCKGSDGKRSVALEYLEEMGVDVEHQVKLIVVTHWHDDHIRGLAQLVRHARAARFACSAALRCVEFFTLVAADREVTPVEHSSGVSEFSDVLDVISSRGNGKIATGPDHWAAEGSRLYSDPKRGVEVWALSPSSQTITASKGAMAAMLPVPGESIRRFYPQEPNALSVVIMVLAPGINLLLGADLEKCADEKRGWRAVISSSVNPKCPSHVYKVAHHGSSGADMDDIWTELLVEQAYAVVTPYARGATPLPSSDDVQRMRQHTDSIYCTAWPATKSPRRRDPAVERTINEMVRTHREIRKQPGQIRARFPFNGCFPSSASLELSDGAASLTASSAT